MPQKPTDDVKNIARKYVKKAQPKTANVNTKREKPDVKGFAQKATPVKNVRLPKGTPDDVRAIVQKYLNPEADNLTRADVLKDIKHIVKAFTKKTPGQGPGEKAPGKAEAPKIKKRTVAPPPAPEPVIPPPTPKDDVQQIVKDKIKKATTMRVGPPSKPTPKPPAPPDDEPDDEEPSTVKSIATAKTKKTSVPDLHPHVVRTDDKPYLTFFDKVKNAMRRDGIPLLTKKARLWMKGKLTDIRTPSRKGLVQKGEKLADVLIGNMFFFFYDAKHKKTLPYWDKFPLIFPLELYDDGFLGLNLHYLDRNLRIRLFDKLLDFANNKMYDDTTRLKLSYALLSSVAKFPEVRPCIKRYLTTQVRSQFLRVHPSEWEISLFLPVEMFQKQSVDAVWADSRRKIRKAKGAKNK